MYLRVAGGHHLADTYPILSQQLGGVGIGGACPYLGSSRARGSQQARTDVQEAVRPVRDVEQMVDEGAWGGQVGIGQNRARRGVGGAAGQVRQVGSKGQGASRAR